MNPQKLTSIPDAKTGKLLVDVLQVNTQIIDNTGKQLLPGQPTRHIAEIVGVKDFDNNYTTNTITLLQLAQRVNAIIETLNKSGGN